MLNFVGANIIVAIGSYSGSYAWMEAWIYNVGRAIKCYASCNCICKVYGVS